MTQPNRLPQGFHVDPGRPLAFTFNGKSYTGLQGDTLASALLANDVRLVGRSFKYHRPRGIVGSGVEEPNALVQLGTGAQTLPNYVATQVELYDGLEASSVNCWPSVGFDLHAVYGLISRFLPPGFYYKTFMWPRSLWPFYERQAAMGRQAWVSRRRSPTRTATTRCTPTATCSWSGRARPESRPLWRRAGPARE